MNSKTKSPLIYPGSKARLASKIIPLFPKGIKTLVSPFFGGGSIEFICATNNIKVAGYDMFKPLVNFWQCAMKDSAKIADFARQYQPLSKEKFLELKKNLKTGVTADKWTRAGWFYVLNRTSFSGTTLAGGMSPGQKAFSLEAILYLEQFKTSGISVKYKSFEKSIPNHPDEFLYCDPPYIIPNASPLYGEDGKLHSGFDHERLAKILNSRGNWVMSYSDCEFVRDTYKRHTIIDPKLSFGIASKRKCGELIIVSEDLKTAKSPSSLFSTAG